MWVTKSILTKLIICQGQKIGLFEGKKIWLNKGLRTSKYIIMSYNIIYKAENIQFRFVQVYLYTNIRFLLP